MVATADYGKVVTFDDADCGSLLFGGNGSRLAGYAIKGYFQGPGDQRTFYLVFLAVSDNDRVSNFGAIHERLVGNDVWWDVSDIVSINPSYRIDAITSIRPELRNCIGRIIICPEGKFLVCKLDRDHGAGFEVFAVSLATGEMFRTIPGQRWVTLRDFSIVARSGDINSEVVFSCQDGSVVP